MAARHSGGHRPGAVVKQKLLTVGLGLAVAGGVIAGGKKTDPDILAAVGKVTAAKLKAAAPSLPAVGGPLAALRVGDALSVEERVRVRIATDKHMDGADVTVVAGRQAGEVRLRGVVRDVEQSGRAVKLAEATVGVEIVANEMAVPE